MAGKQFSLSILFKVIDETTKPIRNISSAVRAISKPIEQIRRSFRRLSRDFSFAQINREIRSIGREALVTANRIRRSLGNALRSVGNRLQSVGRNLSLKLTAPLALFGRQAFKSSLDFNKAMARIGTLDVPISRLNELKETSRDLAIQFGKTTGEMSDGLFDIISAFQDTRKTEGLFAEATKASLADGKASVKDSVRFLVSSLQNFGKISEETAERMINLGFETNRLGVTSFGALARNIGRVAPRARQLGVTAEEMFSVFAALTGVTGDTAEVSVQLAGALNALQKPSEAMKEALKGIQFASAKSAITNLGLVETFRRLIQQTDGSAESTATLFREQRGLLAVVGLLSNATGKKYKTALTSMNRPLNIFEKALLAQTKGINKLGFEWSRFTSLIDIVIQDLGDSLVPIIVKLTEFLIPFVKMIRELNKETKKWFVTFGILLTVLGPFLIIIGAIAKALGFLIGVSLAKFFGVTALAVMALAGTAFVLKKSWAPLGKFFTFLFKDMGKKSKKTKNGIAKDFKELPQQIGSDLKEISNQINSLLTGIGKKLGNSADIAASRTGVFFEKISAGFKKIKENNSNLFASLITDIKNATKEIKKAVDELINIFVPDAFKGFNKSIATVLKNINRILGIKVEPDIESAQLKGTIQEIAPTVLQKGENFKQILKEGLTKFGAGATTIIEKKIDIKNPLEAVSKPIVVNTKGVSFDVFKKILSSLVNTKTDASSPLLGDIRALTKNFLTSQKPLLDKPLKAKNTLLNEKNIVNEKNISKEENFKADINIQVTSPDSNVKVKGITKKNISDRVKLNISTFSQGIRGNVLAAGGIP